MTAAKRLVVGSFATLLCLAGCGPVQYVTTVTLRASRSVSAAEAAEAARCAPYEYTAATEYLRKAREEAGYSDFEAAIDFGHRAIDLGDRAREVSMQRKRADNCATALGPMATGVPLPSVISSPPGGRPITPTPAPSATPL